MNDRNLTTRLNYQVTETAELKLADYCALSGRSASDVVRQLVCEYLDGARDLNASMTPLNGRRTNCTLPVAVVDRMDKRVSGIGQGATKGMVISNLLESWTPDSAVAKKILRELVSAVRDGDYERDDVLQTAEDFLGIERGQKDGRTITNANDGG